MYSVQYPLKALEMRLPVNSDSSWHGVWWRCQSREGGDVWATGHSPSQCVGQCGCMTLFCLLCNVWSPYVSKPSDVPFLLSTHRVDAYIAFHMQLVFHPLFLGKNVKTNKAFNHTIFFSEKQRIFVFLRGTYALNYRSMAVFFFQHWGEGTARLRKAKKQKQQ